MIVPARPAAVLERASTSISVVIPTLDEADRILRLLGALAPQLRSSDEIIVVDGGSTDGTAQLVRGAGLPRVRLLEAPRGRGVQLRAGAEAARQGDLALDLNDQRSRAGGGSLDGPPHQCLSRRVGGSAAGDHRPGAGPARSRSPVR